MVRMILAFLLAAGPAGAACFGPPFPDRVQFESGSVVENLAHTAQDVTYRSLLPDGAPSVVTMRHGLFNMAASNHGTTFSYDWVTPLPDPAALVPGFAATFKADMVVEHASRSFVETDIKVLRREVMQVQGCDYPVLVIARQDRLDGKVRADVTLWLAPALNFSLRTEAVVAGKPVTHQVKAME